MRGRVELADFTTTRRLLPISGIAIVIGVLAAVVALALLRLIGLVTNLCFFQRWDVALVSPAGLHLGPLVVAVPVAGGVLIGLMARFGAILKPVSAAISIGTGGPFGAEGPIIMTGGAFGSMVAQLFRLTAAERKTLLVAGAAAGMSATFASPVAAVLLAVELLLFEWKPRSMIPVALASATAAAARRHLIGLGPLFPVPAHAAAIGPAGLLGCAVVGLLAGMLSVALTAAVYAAEDAFRLLPIHWMWWPALGGVVIGLGGLVFPEALGVGYDVIGGLLQGEVPRRVIVGTLLVKSVIWSVSLGSGTSGGVLAPLLLMGGALGGVEAGFLPDLGTGFWPLVSMGAILGGTMRSPFTGVVFTLELTHDVNALLPLLVAVTIAHGFTVLALRRSILTEKVARRGYHLSREYATDPLEILFVREVMRSKVAVLSPAPSREALVGLLDGHGDGRQQRLYPVVGEDGVVVGVVRRRRIRQLLADTSDGVQPRLDEAIERRPVVAHPDEPLRAVIYRMAETGFTRLPVVERGVRPRLVGMVALTDLLQARVRNLEAEHRRDRFLLLRVMRAS